jgi:site-specific DNA-cytosine methylase
VVRFLPRDGYVRRPVDALTAGFPCEVWSSARSKPAAADDPRRTLYREAIRLAVAVQARSVLFENVPKITSRETVPGSGRLVVDAVRSELRQAGYGNQLEVVLNAARFGAATHRRRWFLLAAMDPGWTCGLRRRRTPGRSPSDRPWPGCRSTRATRPTPATSSRAGTSPPGSVRPCWRGTA